MQASILAPVIPDFDAAPVASNLFQPLLGRQAFNGSRTERVARKEVLRGLEGRRVASDPDHGFHVRKVLRLAGNRPQGDVALIGPSMGFLHTGKRGDVCLSHRQYPVGVAVRPEATSLRQLPLSAMRRAERCRRGWGLMGGVSCRN